MASSVDYVLLLVAVVLVSYHVVVEGGCAGKCCRGSDITCVTADWRMDRVYGTCYCDEGCLRTKDCCYDYPTACPGQSQRHIEQEPRNSGEPCPSLGEQAGCMEHRSNQGEFCAQNTGPAFITTMEFGKGRTKHDIFGAPLDPGTGHTPAGRSTYGRATSCVWPAKPPPCVTIATAARETDKNTIVRSCSIGRLWGTLAVEEHGRRSRELLFLVLVLPVVFRVVLLRVLVFRVVSDEAPR
ncbi:unnamed protein product [Coregonus sp. 'balchen']|nr:unnamed protein product [Coregonus sp. 'balchen']